MDYILATDFKISGAYRTRAEWKGYVFEYVWVGKLMIPSFLSSLIFGERTSCLLVNGFEIQCENFIDAIDISNKLAELYLAKQVNAAEISLKQRAIEFLCDNEKPSDATHIAVAKGVCCGGVLAEFCKDVHGVFVPPGDEDGFFIRGEFFLISDITKGDFSDPAMPVFSEELFDACKAFDECDTSKLVDWKVTEGYVHVAAMKQYKESK